MGAAGPGGRSRWSGSAVAPAERQAGTPPRKVRRIASPRKPQRTANNFTNSEEILDGILPDDPAVVVQGIRQLFGENLWDQDARPFWAKAQRLLEGQPLVSAADFHLKGVILEALDSPEDAATAYRLALARPDARMEWRCDLARTLWGANHLTEAKHELSTFLIQQPGHDAGRKLLALIVAGKIARKDRSP